MNPLDLLNADESQSGEPEQLGANILDIARTLSRDDQPVREGKIRIWKRNEYYWKGYQDIYWSELARDWMVPGIERFDEEGSEYDPETLGKILNIYRAHGESVIAALSSALPYVRFFPDDSENPDDISTAKAWSKIAELVCKHNKALTLFTKACYILWTQDFVAAYNYHHKDKSFGTTRSPIYGTQNVRRTNSFCTTCGDQLGEQVDPLEDSTPPGGDSNGIVEGNENSLGAEGGPDVAQGDIDPQAQEVLSSILPSGLDDSDAMESSVAPHPLETPTECPNCGNFDVPSLQVSHDQIPIIKDYEDVPKGRETIELFGPLNVKLPITARSLEDCGYLILETEQHISLMKEIYPDIADKITGSAPYTRYDRWGRQPISNVEDVSVQYVTVSRVWLRPWTYNNLDKEQALVLKTNFPDGCYAVYVGDIFAEAYNESMDDHWTITISPISSYIHGDPIGEALIPVQEMDNELVNLTFETIKYGISETFADPKVLDFALYSQSEIKPGSYFPAQPRSGQQLSDAFYSPPRATLSQEVGVFQISLDNRAQFLVGDFPSIYGGPNDSGSKTLGEYQMSRNQALQRLGTPWKMLNIWWAEVMKKCVRSYANNIHDDERFSKREGDSFINVWIRKAELTGSVGSVEPESSDQFPVSWAQKRGVILDLMHMNKEPLDLAMFHPENTQLVAELLGVPEFYVPGAEDRQAQLQEISELVKGQPLGPMMPSVPIDPDIDDDDIHIQVCKSFLNGEVGKALKQENPAGYQNVLAHLRMHNQHKQMMMMQQMMSKLQGPPQGPSQKPPSGPPKVSAPKPNGAVESPQVGAM